ncbi:MAG TPA: prepilin peptidase [Burkholderiaceae bacterium]|nr:prepilin peptidase [Burkholderiaceae bacterium]
MPAPQLLCTLALSGVLLAAVISDVRTRRIPNLLVAAGMLAGLALQVLAPHSEGLFAFWWGGLGLAQALLGLLAGLAIFMPLHLIRVVGAGDVKLLAMAGVWLGPKMLPGAVLLTLLAGGVMALVAMLASHSTRQVLANVRVMLTSALIDVQLGRPAALDAPAPGAIRLPYALAIAIGTLGEVGWVLLHAQP